MNQHKRAVLEYWEGVLADKEKEFEKLKAPSQKRDAELDIFIHRRIVYDARINAGVAVCHGEAEICLKIPVRRCKTRKHDMWGTLPIDF